jgi:hypothetical protein
MTLFSSANSVVRTRDGQRQDILSVMLMLAPALSSGKNLCPYASKGCADACLYYSGRGAMPLTQQARLARTQKFLDDREAFTAQLSDEIDSLTIKANRIGMKTGTTPTVAVRLNGTSDILWEKQSFDRIGSRWANLMELHPDVQFYDYTKIPRRMLFNPLPNYHLTFSLSEVNDTHALAELEEGRNVAVVMRYDTLPTTWSGFPVVYGDESDYRFLDPVGGHIVALRANGRALKDTTGFARDVDDVLDPSRTFVPFTKAMR